MEMIKNFVAIVARILGMDFHAQAVREVRAEQEVATRQAVENLARGGAGH